MKIETKFNVGDEVWFINNNKIAKSRIIKVYYSCSENFSNESYSLKTGNSPIDYIERGIHQVFTTKEELINSL